MCFNNPDHRGFLVGLTQDYTKSHDIDGLMWGSERQGAFSNALGAAHGGKKPRSRQSHLLLRILSEEGP